MALIRTDGVEQEAELMQRLAVLPDELQAEVLRAQASVVADAIRRSGERYRVRDTLSSLREGKVKRDRRGDMSLYLRFEGKNKRGVRYTEIAFVNNYGTTKQSARPFVTEAVNASAEAAYEVAEKIYDDWVSAQERKG